MNKNLEDESLRDFLFMRFGHPPPRSIRKGESWDLTPMVTIFRRDGLSLSQGRGHVVESYLVRWRGRCHKQYFVFGSLAPPRSGRLGGQMKNGLGRNVNETVFMFYSYKKLFVFAYFCLWQHRRLFGRERDKFMFAGFLLFFQIRDDGLQIVIKFFRVLVARFAYFFNNWIVPHLTPPSVPSENKSQAVHNR